jgi:hypothetical protein
MLLPYIFGFWGLMSVKIISQRAGTNCKSIFLAGQDLGSTVSTGYGDGLKKAGKNAQKFAKVCKN